MAADQIFIAEPAPPCCSACFQAKPQERHVDFSAAYDGPAVPALENTVGVVAHTIDDLIICETCLTEAAKLVGLANAGTLTAEIDQLSAANSELHAKLRGYEDYAAKLEAAVAAKPVSTPRAKAKPKAAAR